MGSTKKSVSKTVSKKLSPKAKATGAAASPAGASAPTKREALYDGLLNGLQGASLGSGELILSTGTTTVVDLIAQVQAGLEAIAATKTARATWLRAVGAQNGSDAQLEPVVTALREYLRARFGAGSITLAEFGMKATVRKKPTVATLAEAAVKRKAAKAAKKAPAASVQTPAQAPAPAGHATASGNA